MLLAPICQRRVGILESTRQANIGKLAFPCSRSTYISVDSDCEIRLIAKHIKKGITKFTQSEEQGCGRTFFFNRLKLEMSVPVLLLSALKTDSSLLPSIVSSTRIYTLAEIERLERGCGFVLINFNRQNCTLA